MATTMISAARTAAGSLLLTLIVSQALTPGTARAQAFAAADSAVTRYNQPTLRATHNCADLSAAGLRDIVTLTAQMMPAAGDLPAYCQVDGTLDPEITFQVNLPIEWNRRFYMIGNGGVAGQQPNDAFNAPQRRDALNNHFVIAMTDTGHNARTEPGGTFALSNPQKVIDYAYRAVHLTAVTARAIALQFYGEPVEYAYFNSCSNGGRQALLESQRYPDDFDGIVANAPWVNQSQYVIGAMWNQRAQDEAPLTAEKVALVAEHVMAKCDAVDGLADGLISAPLSCPINVAEDVPLCAAGTDSNACLTPAQADTVQKIYDGPRTSSGEQIFPGFMPGSEALVNGNSAWMGMIVPARPGAATADFGISMAIMQYLVPLTPDPDWDYRTFDFDTDLDMVERWGLLADADDINLREFRANGGKLIITYGWADTVLHPLMGVNYYEQAVTANGPDGDEFMRLFMIPGMTHCSGGNGTDVHDPVTTIIDWVEAGIAPDSMPGSRVVNGEVVRTRPLCPYPQIARYDGSGSIDEAENFSCEAP